MQTILVIEDDTFLLDAYQVKLQQAKYRIVGAKDGREGLELATGEQPDLIILDLIMPVMSGLEVLKRLKEQEATEKIPVIIASNIDDEQVIKQGMELGAVDYFVKSNISINNLIDKVDQYL
jgi:DNA-binding response OmpR family regulator